MSRFHVTIVGGGIIGVTCANRLLDAGHAVRIVDRGDPRRSSSFGNAGLISPGAVVPYAMPGALSNVPKWLLDPMGPLAIRWRDLPSTVPWMLRWARASAADRAADISRAMHVLHKDALSHYEPLMEGTTAKQLIRRNGSLVLSERQGGATPTALAQKLQRSFGIRCDLLDAQALRDLDPGLPASALHGQYFPDNAHCDDSFKLVQLLARKAAARGADLVQAEAHSFEYADGQPSALRTDKGSFVLDRLLIAAGIWSAPLARQLGSRLPLQAERGYHVHLPMPDIPLPRIPFRHKERSFAVTPMGSGIRFAGTAELASAEAAPNWRRSDRLAELASGLFPGISQAGATRWMGSRPSFPDGLPVLGRSPHHANLFFAFGSGHFGLTEAPTMAHVIADLVSDRTPAIDLAPFAPTRF